MLDTVQYVLGALSGVVIGLTLGLVGGGGSILALPLMVYVVCVPSAHTAIGTSALTVAVNAALGLFQHARRGNVVWRCGGMFAAAGMAGAFLGSTVGKAVDGEKLLFLFALLMIFVGGAMLRRRAGNVDEDVECDRTNAPKVIGFGAGTGLLSGFFGIGGGFLIVPALITSTGMPMFRAVGTSLVAVTAFGLTAAANYAASGYVDWVLAIVLIAGGFIGSFAGTHLAGRLTGSGKLNTVFVTLVFGVAFYMMWHSLSASGMLS